MTLDDLRVFVAVCEGGNLTAVARQLACSQSAVSQHVKRLENETGLALLEREPRGVTPTSAGRLLHQAAVEVLSGLDTTLGALDQLRTGHVGPIRITTGGPTIRHFMAPAIRAFRARHPEVAFDFQSAHSSARCLQAIRDNEADLAWITIGDEVRGVQQRPVIDMPWLLVVRPDDPLASRDTVRARDLRAIRYISLPDNSTSRRQLHAHLVRKGIHLVSSSSAAEWDTTLLLVELGFGQAIVPSPPAIDFTDTKNLRAIPLEAIPPLTAGWAVRNWDTLPPAAAEFATTVADRLQRPPGTGRS